MESTTPSILQCTLFTMYCTLYIVHCTIYFYTLYSYTSMFKSMSFLYDQQLYYIIYIVHHFLQRIVEYIEAHTHTSINLHIQHMRRTHILTLPHTLSHTYTYSIYVVRTYTNYHTHTHTQNTLIKTHMQCTYINTTLNQSINQYMMY